MHYLSDGLGRLVTHNRVAEEPFPEHVIGIFQIDWDAAIPYRSVRLTAGYTSSADDLARIVAVGTERASSTGETPLLEARRAMDHYLRAGAAGSGREGYEMVDLPQFALC